MNFEQPPKVESGATASKPELSKGENGESFENEFNKKRLSDIVSQLSSIVYDFEEKEINIETVKYIVKGIKNELYRMSEASDDVNLRYAYKELDGFVRDIASEDDDENIAQKIKNTVNLIEQVK